MNFNSLLFQAGYSQNKNSSIWQKYGYEGIEYSDGDIIEERIAKIISEANDISIFSTELAAQCTDWPSLYHLSGTRANILRPFQTQIKQANVLEIGAGCGAITRYLGESGANVLSLEGSPRRAAIARSRTRDLDNVTIVADRFDQFQCDCRFDVITLIGVLEYAALFTEGDDPAVTMLEQVRKLLLPDGMLIIAIENQLGLKYFAGAAEDHTGEPMLGIEGRYSTKGPRTFGRKVIANLLKQAGFANQEFMAPFPDYKLPFSIITEHGLKCDTFDAAALCWQNATRDPQLASSQLIFAPELAWQVVEANGLALDLANSFLIAAYVADEVKFDTSTLAYHYSTSGRHASFCKETLFAKQENDNIELIYNPLGSEPIRNAEGTYIQFNIPARAPYIYGELLSLRLLKIVTRDNWEIKEIGDFLRLFLGIVESYLIKKGSPTSFTSILSLLPGTCFDIIPQNILCLPDGTYQIIDQEWTLKEEIPLGWLLYRSLLQLMYSTTRFGKTSSSFPETRLDLFLSSFKNAGFQVTKGDLENYAVMENRVLSDICKLIGGPANIKALDLRAYLDKNSVHSLLKNQTKSLIENQIELSSKSTELIELVKKISSKDKYIKSINYKLSLQIDQNKFLKENLMKQEQKVSFLYTYLTKNALVEYGFHINRFRLRNLKSHYFNIRKIKKSKLFCYEWYNDTYSEVQDLNLDPLVYFYYFGYHEGQNPNPYFDSSWYLNTYEDVSKAKFNPLLHYILHGAEEGKNPSPYFDTNWYLTQYKDVEESGQNPLVHFLLHGAKEGRNPNPYFDSLWYKSAYPEIESSGMEPFLHYITIGSKQGKNPSPYFHTSWYLNRYHDVREAGIEPLKHYINYGSQEGKDPNPLFDSKWFSKKYQDALKSNQQPLLHYIQTWSADWVNPNEFFDVEWYLTMYPDVKEKKIDPLIHYLYNGVEEIKNPCPSFNTEWYLREYKDVRDSGINPLEHYIHFGQHEGRLPTPDRTTKIDINKTLPVGILCTPHTKYLADQIANTLSKISVNSFIIYEPPPEGYGKEIYFVICPQMFPYLPEKYIVFQMEQTINSRWFDYNYYTILENSQSILDYSIDNIEYLRSEFKIQNKQLYYIPIDYINEYDAGKEKQNETYDVLFYGDPNCDRRQEILSEISKFFNIKIISDTFGPKLYEEILKSKIIINIHYYEGALLETTRIWECLSLNRLIISEKSVDINHHDDLYELVDFVNIYDIDNLIKRISYWLENENFRKQKINENKYRLNNRLNRFELFFFRFMLAHENITFDDFWEICGRHLSLDKDKIICLTLPEFPERKKTFRKSNATQVHFFNGLKHYKHGWIGCGMSYKLMAKLAKQQNLENITISEDDVEFLDNFEQKFYNIKNHIVNLKKPWDVFSGFMSDISDDIEIKEIITFHNQELLLVNKMISMVFNLYNNSIYDTIISWDENNRNVNINTIDRFLEQKNNFIIYLSFPFLVDHKEELQSTIWGFTNTKYNDLIKKSIQLLRTKIAAKKSIPDH